MSKILIIDDDQELCTILSIQIKAMGHETFVSHTLQEGYHHCLSEPVDLVFLDVRLPDGNGLNILPAIRQKENPPEVIIMTGTGDADGAETAINSGAWDYIEKPYSIKQMMLPLIRALEYREACTLSGKKKVLDLSGIIGSSHPLRACIDILEKTAASETNVLLTGETGTGKEVFALAIHKNSGRARKDFVIVDCGAMTETLTESVLFGHEKGAFTGADRKRIGLLKAADGGTLFLDEVGELPLVVQRSLLRALQEHRFRPVGGDQEIESNFRLVAATNRNIDELVRMGRFREDLLHRLRGVSIHLPPLRERYGDLQELAAYFIKRCCIQNDMEPKTVSSDFLEMLKNYAWPGNVRELQHTMEQTVLYARDIPVLYPEHLPTDIRAGIAKAAFVRRQDTCTQVRTSFDTPFPTLDKHEWQTREEYLKRLIQHAGGDYRLACRLSGLSKSRLYRFLKSHGMTLKS